MTSCFRSDQVHSPWYAVNPAMLLSIDYRYFATADPEFDVLIESEYGSHNLFFGVRFSF